MRTVQYIWGRAFCRGIFWEKGNILCSIWIEHYFNYLLLIAHYFISYLLLIANNFIFLLLIAHYFKCYQLLIAPLHQQSTADSTLIHQLSTADSTLLHQLSTAANKELHLSTTDSMVTSSAIYYWQHTSSSAIFCW